MRRGDSCTSYRFIRSNWYARKRSTLAAAMVFTAPGIPMLFQGQEFLEGGWFRDTVPVDWDQKDEFHGIVRLYRDLIRLRLNHAGFTRGLCGQFTQVFHLNEESNVIAFHRWDKGGPADDVVIVANFLNEPQDPGCREGAVLADEDVDARVFPELADLFEAAA